MNGSNEVGARSVGVLGRCVAVLTGLGVMATGLVVVAPDAAADPWKAPDTPQFKFAPTKKVKPGSVSTKGVANVRPSKVTWPAAVNDAPVATLPKVGSRGRATGTPISVARVKAQDPGQVTVSVLDRARSDSMVGSGMVFTVAAEPDTPLEVSVDTSQIAGLAGGDFAGRLRLVKMAGCDVNDPTTKACRAGSRVADAQTEGSAVKGRVSTDAAGVAVMALAAGASSDQGSFGATSLKPSSSWESGGSSGTFSWSYPIATPDVAGSLSPDLSIGYSSGATDGAVSTTNNQASWVGEGFDLPVGFIERKFVGGVRWSV